MEITENLSKEVLVLLGDHHRVLLLEGGAEALNKRRPVHLIVLRRSVEDYLTFRMKRLMS